MSRTYNFHITNNTNETIYYGCYYSSSTTYCGYPDCIPSSYYVALAAGQSATKTVTLSSSYCGTFAIKSTTASFLLNSKRYQYNSTNVSDKIWYLAGKFIYASLLGSSQSTTDDYYYTVDSIIPFNQVPVTIGSKRALSALTTTNTQMSEEPLRYYLDSNGEIQFTYTIRKPLKFSSSSYSSNLYALSSSQSSSNYVSKLSYKKLFGSNPYYSYISCYICKQDSAPTSEELSSLLSWYCFYTLAETGIAEGALQLGPGQHKIIVRSRDANNNKSKASTPIYFSVGNKSVKVTSDSHLTYTFGTTITYSVTCDNGVKINNGTFNSFSKNDLLTNVDALQLKACLTENTVSGAETHIYTSVDKLEKRDGFNCDITNPACISATQYNNIGETISQVASNITTDLVLNSDISWPCFKAGTKITLADRTTKNIEDLTYDDELLCWDFDNGYFTKAKPIILTKSKLKALNYNKLTFEDGVVLNTIGDHRIFNLQHGKFEYVANGDFQIGNNAFFEDNYFIKLQNVEIIDEENIAYNIITDKYLNCFANGILTSCRLSNIYPIDNMKYIKDSRVITPESYFEDLPEHWYDGLRLGEQPLQNTGSNQYHHKLIDLKSYINSLKENCLPISYNKGEK